MVTTRKISSAVVKFIVGAITLAKLCINVILDQIKAFDTTNMKILTFKERTHKRYIGSEAGAGRQFV